MWVHVCAVVSVEVRGHLEDISSIFHVGWWQMLLSTKLSHQFPEWASPVVGYSIGF